MTQFIGQIITFQGHDYRVIGLHPRWEMFEVEELNRNFKTLIAFDEVE